MLRILDLLTHSEHAEWRHLLLCLPWVKTNKCPKDFFRHFFFQRLILFCAHTKALYFATKIHNKHGNNKIRI